MPRTRALKPTAAESKDEDTTAKGASTKITLPPRAESPPKVFILPKAVTKEAKIVTLPHPRHAQPSRYLVCPETGFYEFTRFSPPKDDPRSWLIEGSVEGGGSEGQVASSADMFVATAMDPLFLVIPALAESTVGRTAEEQKRLFLTSDDYFDKLPEEYSHLNNILRWDKPRTLLERRMTAVCDTVDAGDESMYRLNKEKLVSVCLQKARQLAEGDSFPSSLEKEFVTKALQAPISHKKLVKGEQKENLPPTESFDSGTSTPQTENNDSQSTTATTETAATSVDADAIEVVEAIKASDAVVKLQKLRVAFDLICSRLISPKTAQWLKEDLSEDKSTGVNFAPLNEYLAQVSKLRAEAMASRSMGDYSNKRMRDEDEDEAREAKKKKMEDEKKRKANESRGVRDLKKVNTSGMKKLSAFFTKK